MSKFGIAQPVRRVEDQRFLTGAGSYVDDVRVAGLAHAWVVRSPVAHARIRSIDVRAARAAPGVLGILTGEELAAAGANHLPCVTPLRSRDGSPNADPGHPVLCTERVRFAGDGVALVVAETATAAREAAEQVLVDYEELAAVVDTARAAAEGQPLVHDDVPGNLCFDWEHGDAAAVERAFADAAHVTNLELVNNRVIACSLETRGVIAEWDEAAGRMTLHLNGQGGWNAREILARHVLGIPPRQLRVLTPDVGGGFGMKVPIYPEQAMVAWAARKLKRPVKWMSERGEAFLADTQGRDHVTRASLAFDAGHRIVGLRVECTANLGAYLSLFGPFIPTGAALKVLPGVYDVKAAYFRVRGVFTNTVPVDAYRGAGRPEAIYVIERLIDQAARELGLDPPELRRRCFIPPEAMPFRTAVGEIYDSGDFPRVLDAALAAADWAGFPARREAARARGRLRGIGLGYYVESTMGNPQERAAVRFPEGGGVEIYVGTQSNGQGHETAYTQILHERLGVPFESIRVIQGDTDRIPTGGGTGGSRSVTAEGWAIGDAAEAVIERGRHYAAAHLEAAPADIEHHQGSFRVVGTDRAVDLLTLADAARRMPPPAQGLEGGLDAQATIEVKAWTFPNGCHVAEVEIDPETGVTRLERYTVVDDFGRVINPMLLEGQVHGGVVQGVGQALMEQAAYDEGGQLLTGSFLDYCLPRADDLPMFGFSTVEIPCPNNPLGMKGAGEAGTVGSLASTINAVIDALAPLGVKSVDMPATPERIWRLTRGTA
jgi:aerobic carbon-monoxide dehydrogenase large subunit